VARRRVFYIPGYDPFPPRRYRELYRAEALLQADVSGHEIALGPRPQGRHYGWQVSARIEGESTVAALEVLGWSDIVRASMGQGIAATYLQLARTAWAYIGSGALVQLMRLRRGPMIAALYPVAALLIQLLAAAAAAGLTARLLGGWLRPLGAGPQWGGAALAAGGVLCLILHLCRRADGRILAWYLMHDYAFTAAGGGAYPTALEARLAAFRARIAAALREDWDEVLVVGHSSGAHLAVSVLADVIRAGSAGPGGPALSLLTLGQVVPMVSFLPKADRLRADLAFLSQREELTWVDVTAPGDGCAFALCDPVAVSGMAGPGKRWPLVVSAAFSQTLSPERWQGLRRRYFRLHFQYLCAFDRPGIYDYFAITAGPRTLAARFRGRAPSKSRIETPLNPFGAVRP
jgi:hypothetical protein